MAAFSYLDASAIVKLVLREAETEAMESEVVTRDALFSSRLSAAEVRRAVRRARSATPAERATERIEEIFDALFFIDVSPDVLYQAGIVGPDQLRTLDAIHIATALGINEPELEVITYDKRLARAAEAMGLRVVQPGLKAPA